MIFCYPRTRRMLRECTRVTITILLGDQGGWTSRSYSYTNESQIKEPVKCRWYSHTEDIYKNVIIISSQWWVVSWRRSVEVGVLFSGRWWQRALRYDTIHIAHAVSFGIAENGNIKCNEYMSGWWMTLGGWWISPHIYVVLIPACTYTHSYIEQQHSSKIEIGKSDNGGIWKFIWIIYI